MDNAEMIRVCDCTLRQGEKSPELSFREKIELCRLLDKLDIELTEKQLCDVYNQVKALGDKGKKVSDIELQSIAISELSTGEKEYRACLLIVLMNTRNAFTPLQKARLFTVKNANINMCSTRSIAGSRHGLTAKHWHTDNCHPTGLSTRSGT